MTPFERNQNTEKLAASTSLLTEQVCRRVLWIAESDCPILIIGEPGVGKRTTAMEIHAHSRRSREIFKEYSCRDLDPQTIRSMLGMNGTAYLADVGDLRPGLQDLILEAYFLASQAQTCRLLFGSSREFLEDVTALRFREDFYYLVSAVTLRIAPLRLRKPEILNIADALVSLYSKQFDLPKPTFSEEIIEFLLSHSWPDNLPELRTAVKTVVAIGDQAISLGVLKARAPISEPNSHRTNLSLKEATRQASFEVQRQMISQVLRSTGGNRKRAARELGISYKALLYKTKQIALGKPSAHHRIGVAK